MFVLKMFGEIVLVYDNSNIYGGRRAFGFLIPKFFVEI